jgi:glycosyltransferase involved in cell wall biosynthesis
MTAPIALFVYNRPWHTRQSVESLQSNTLAAESELIIFSDGPGAKADIAKVEAVRNFCRKVSGFSKVKLIERNANLGLSKSIMDGVEDVLKEHDRLIVLEDDIVTSPYFLSYMNGSLDMYEHDDRVISIHSYVYPVKDTLPETFFLLGADCQGWATWRRGWELFEKNGAKLLAELKARNLTRDFDFNGSYPYTRMLQQQIAGKTQSWAVRWYASAFLKGKYTLYPGKSFIHNIGFDSSGTNCSTADFFNGEMISSPPSLQKADVEDNVVARQAIEKYFRRVQSPIFKLQNRMQAYMKQQLNKLSATKTTAY